MSMEPDSVRLPRRVSSGKVDWTKTLTARLIELYKHFSDIWDCKSPKYSDRKHRKRLMEKIAQLMEIDVRDVCSKIHNIRCQYNSEIRKIRRGKNRSGTALAHDYTPKWEFFETLSFLANATKKCTNADIMYKMEETDDGNSNVDYDLPENTAKMEMDFIEDQSSEEQSNLKDHVSNFIITEDIVVQAPQTNLVTSTAVRPKSPSSKRRRAEKAKIILKNREVSNDAVMANAMKTLSASFDSHKIFCDYLADQMRSMSVKNCKILKRIIQKAIVQLDENSDNDPLDMDII